MLESLGMLLSHFLGKNETVKKCEAIKNSDLEILLSRLFGKYETPGKCVHLLCLLPNKRRQRTA